MSIRFNTPPVFDGIECDPEIDHASCFLVYSKESFLRESKYSFLRTRTFSRAVFMGNPITDSWIRESPEFFANNDFVDREINGPNSP